MSYLPLIEKIKLLESELGQKTVHPILEPFKFDSGNGYYVLSITTPLASFIVGGLFWQLMVRNIRDTSQIVIVGLLTGTIAHYITFILLNWIKYMLLVNWRLYRFPGWTTSKYMVYVRRSFSIILF